MIYLLLPISPKPRQAEVKMVEQEGEGSMDHTAAEATRSHFMRDKVLEGLWCQRFKMAAGDATEGAVTLLLAWNMV